MRRAIELARRGTGTTSPNPMVGAVVVRDGRVVASGYHHRCGLPHAEALALEEAGPSARGADLYVNLEPCCHVGRTPPCTEAIVRAGIRRVFAAVRDPNPLVNGKGLESLQRHGVEVHEGFLREEAFRLNEVFFKRMRTGTPFVALKAAVSLDGKLATSSGQSRWITGEAARRHGHLLRGTYDAVLVGIGTVTADDPALTCRLSGRLRRDPRRIVVDSRLSIGHGARVLDGGDPDRVIIATTGAASRSNKMKELEGRSTLLVVNEDGPVHLPTLLRRLSELEITSVLVEGGSRINGSFLADDLVDRYYLYLAPRIIGGEKAIGAFGGDGVAALELAPGLAEVSVRKLGEDLLVTGCRPHAWRHPDP